MKRAFAPLVVSLLAASFLSPSAANAQWVENGTAVCAAPLAQDKVAMVSDGSGGAIVIWEDRRSGGVDLYAQRFDGYGRMLWSAGGARIGAISADRTGEILLPDGAGGAIVVWTYLETSIRAQRIDGNGTALWQAGGVVVRAMPDTMYGFDAAVDGEGGIVVAWSEVRVDSLSFDVLAQRISANGAPAWQAGGVVACGARGTQGEVRVVPDGSGGAVVAWTDWRSGTGDIYARKVDRYGLAVWTSDGVPLCAASYEQGGPFLVPDGLGGAIAAWWDNRNAGDDVYAQRISRDGSTLWSAQGVPLAAGPGTHLLADVAPDGEGGAIAVWDESPSIDESNVFAQRIDANGATRWLPNGMAVCAAPGLQWSARVATNGVGGAIVAWQDARLGVDVNVYAQSIDASGIAQWALNGIAVCDAADAQTLPAIVSDGAGGALVAWSDRRSGTSDVYAQRIERGGYWGYPAPAIFAIRDVPGDQGGMINLAWDASRLDPWPYQLILNYSIWRAISPTEAALAIASGEADERIPNADIPSLRVEQAAGQVFYWKFISYLYAASFEHYSENVATLFDSTAVCDETHYFQVVAHPTAGKDFWASAPDSGYSVDNLAPATPCSLAARQTGDAIRIVWAPNRESDLSQYALYRGLTEDVPLDEPLLCTIDTVAIDTGWTAASNDYYYKLVAFDVHGNASPAALLRPGSVVATLLSGFSCSLVDGSVLLEWRLVECDEGSSFSVERAAGAGAAFAPLPGAAIEREGLVLRFADGACEPGTVCRYRVTYESAGERTLLFETEPVAIPSAAIVLHQNAPNPFNPSTTIRFYLPRDARATLDVFDVSGRLVARLFDGALRKGSHSFAWRGEEGSGGGASSGVYFCVLRAGKETLTRKMVLLR